MIQRAIYPPLVEHPRLRQSLTEGEKKVLDVFNDHLPSDWEIYIQPHLNGLRPDFVLMNPNGGIGVFEVKDWDLRAMRYFTKKDQWGHTLWAERDGKEFCIQKENPITKVNLYKKEIFDLYCPRLQKGNGWAAITAGAIFPFARADDVKKLFEPFLKSTSGDRYARYQPVSGIEELSSGDLEAIFPEFSRTGSRVMSEDRAQDLRGWLVEPDFASTQRKPLVLDRNQRTLAETRTDTGYRRIKGPAGSGKSLVLASRAARLANEGKSVLVATFNITLWHYLRDLIVRDIDAPHRIRNIQFTHFHLWCKHVCHEVGWEHRYDDLWKSVLSDGRKEDVLNVALPRLAEEAINQPGASRYDAILVDEGQDYRPLWWNVLRQACKPDGEMLLVADATQDVYGTARAWTDDVMKGAGFPGGRWAQLNVSYRLPPDALNLARNFAEAFLPKEVIDLPEPEQGSLDLYPCHLRWVQCDPDNAEKVCSDEILYLMRETGKDGFREIDDADPALAFSPLVRGVEKTFAWIGEHGGIPLTPSKAFKRVFVHWAATEFDWPGHTEADLFAVNKVLNEPDFAPLMVLHDLMIAMKLGRHYKGEFRLTKAGQALVGHPGRIFGTVVPFFLFRINHANMSRFEDASILGNWDVFLNVLNVETEDGATGAHLRRVLFGEPEKGQLPRYDEVMGQLYIQVLRPLCWAGLLQQGHGTASYRFEEAVFMKTPLWRAALRLETDGVVGRATRH